MAFPRTTQMLAADRNRLTALSLGLMAILLGLWIAWALLARVTVYAVTDTARLEVDRAAHVIEAPVAGRVVAIALTLGQVVTRDTVLVELEAQPQRLQLEEVQTRLAALSRQITHLDAERDAAEFGPQGSSEGRPGGRTRSPGTVPRSAGHGPVCH